MGKAEILNNELHHSFLCSTWFLCEWSLLRRRNAFHLPFCCPPVLVPGIFLHVSPRGRELELTFKWPNPLKNVEQLHLQWICDAETKMEMYHPKFLGFENFLKGLRERGTDRVESLDHIFLPFVFQTHIVRRTPLGWRDSSGHLIHVYIKA